MKNLNNERISKSIEKEEKIEQKNTLQQSEELKEQNKKDNSIMKNLVLIIIPYV